MWLIQNCFYKCWLWSLPYSRRYKIILLCTFIAEVNSWPYPLSDGPSCALCHSEFCSEFLGFLWKVWLKKNFDYYYYCHCCYIHTYMHKFINIILTIIKKKAISFTVEGHRRGWKEERERRKWCNTILIKNIKKYLISIWKESGDYLNTCINFAHVGFI